MIARRPAAVLTFTLLASLASLVLALVAEHGFGLKPCELCMMQRVPYVVVILLALLGLGLPGIRFWATLLIGVAFLVDSGIAGYHAAVEEHWIAGPSACTDTETKAVQSLDEFLNKIHHAPVVACDQPQWEWNGITMANLNALWALALAIAVLASLSRKGAAHA